MATTLDRTKDFGIIQGGGHGSPKFVQDGLDFDAQGVCMTKVPKAAVDAQRLVEDASAPPENEPLEDISECTRPELVARLSALGGTVLRTDTKSGLIMKIESLLKS
jgi:hypothetical protein